MERTIRKAATPAKKICKTSRKLRHVGFAKKKGMCRTTVPNLLYRK
jgi:hypothetical protein